MTSPRWYSADKVAALLAGKVDGVSLELAVAQKVGTGGPLDTELAGVMGPAVATEATRATAAEESISSSLAGHVADTSNPHGVTKAQVGLGSVDNTADLDKPVSTAAAAALADKQDAASLLTAVGTGITEADPDVVAPLDARYARIVSPSGDVTGATDTAAIQANENAGISTRLVGGATYYVSGLVKKSAASIFLDDGTLKLPDGANNDVIISDGFAGLSGSNTTGGVYDVGIYGPGDIDGNVAHQTLTNPTVTSAPFNMAPTFTMTVSDSTHMGPTGAATVNTLSGPQTFQWTANDTTTGTLTCTSSTTGRISTGNTICWTGFGIRLYGRNLRIKNVRVHHTLADGIWTEWGSGNAGPGTSEMESIISGCKVHECNRNGYSLLGPHDSVVDRCWAYRNKSRGFATGNGSIYYFNLCHAWGAPQIISFEDHTASKFTNCCGEMTATAGSRSWTLYASAAQLSGCFVLYGGGSGGGNIGVELLNNAAGCTIDAIFSGGFGSGLVALTASGGGNSIRGTANTLGSNSMITGTPAATDVIDIIAGSGTTTPRYRKGFDISTQGPGDFGFAGWAFDPALSPSGTPPSSGAVKYIRVKAVDTRSITQLMVGISTAGAGLTTGQCLLGLYDDTGTLLATSGDQSVAWASTGAKVATITATPVTAGRNYYIGLLAVGTTPPAFARGFSANNDFANVGFTTAPYRFNSGATGQTTMPASFAPTGLGKEIAFWAGMA